MNDPKTFNVLMSEVHSVWYKVEAENEEEAAEKALYGCLLYTSPSPRD